MNNSLNEISRHPAPSTLEAPSQSLKFQRKQALYHNGDPAQSVFRVRDGLIRITRMTPEGRILTVRHVMPGDFFGEEAFMDGRREEIAEALTNAVKHAAAPRVGVRVAVEPVERTGARVLVCEVVDDGVGGADPGGTGLTGLADRVDALNGTVDLISPPGVGTTLRVALPVPAPAG